MKMLSLLYVVFMLLICTSSAMAAAPPSTPFIRINTELHSARITDITSDAKGTLLATASYDKTVKIWLADSGKLVKTLRPPVGKGVEGTLNTVAFSPDGSILATAGRTGYSWDKAYSVYLFDVGTGEMNRRIGGFSDPVQRLAFSPDGKRLAVGLNSSGGVIVVNLDDGGRTSDQAGFNGNCFGIDFDAQGNLIASSDEGIIKMYRPDGTIAYALQSDNGRQIYSVRFSPDGSLFAVGYDDRNTVEVRNSRDGSVAFVFSEPKGHLSSVAWSADGRHIMAAGGKQGPDARKLLIKWSVKWRNLDEQIVLPVKNAITKILPLKSGLVAFVSRQSGFGAIGGEGHYFGVAASGKSGGRKTEQLLTEISFAEGSHSYFNRIAVVDFEKNHDSFKISADAGSVLFSYERYGQQKALFDLKKRRLITSGNLLESGLLPPRFTGNGVDVRNWENSAEPRLNEKILKNFGSREKSHSLSVRSDEDGFVLGTSHYLRSYSKKGKLLWKQRVPQVAWDVNISTDNCTVVAALDDSTIRWYRMKDGQEICALYIHPDRKRWILWSPDGFFDHGPDSEDLIGFLVNRSADKSSVMVAVEQMYDTFYRPDIIDKIIAGADVSVYRQRLAVRAKAPATAKELLSVDSEKQAHEEKLSQEQASLKAEEERNVAVLLVRAAAEQKEREKVASEKLVEEQAQKERLRLEQVKVEKVAPNVVIPPADETVANEDPPEVVTDSILAGLVNTAKLPPKVRFISTSGSGKERDVTLQAELCDSGGGIGNVTLFINDTPVSFEQGGRGLAMRNKSAVLACQSFERVVTLAPGRNVISLMAFNSDNSIESNRDQLTLNYVAADTGKPQLHILTIAVNNYRDGDLRLKHSINDAEGVIGLATEKGQTLFSGIVANRLHDEQVTKANMESIFASIGAKTKRGDVFLLFMAGHGLTDDTDGMYYFLPADFRYTGPESVAAKGISMNDFKRFLSGIQAMKTLFLIDTCNSGSFSEAVATRGVMDKTSISKLARAVGRATIAASSKNQVALEGYEGHGVFSYILMEGMKGKAADKKGEITINRLATYIEEELPELTFKKWGYEQIPQKTLIGSDFSIGIK